MTGVNPVVGNAFRFSSSISSSVTWSSVSCAASDRKRNAVTREGVKKEHKRGRDASYMIRESSGADQSAETLTATTATAEQLYSSDCS